MRQVFERRPLVDPSGIVDPVRAARAFSLVRVPPEAGLARFVERHWVLSWDLPDGVSHTQVVVPHPCVNLVVEADGTRVHGIPHGTFERTLTGRGVVVGTKFRPGGFRPFLGRSVARLTGTSVPAADLLGTAAPGPEVLGTAWTDPVAAARQAGASLLGHPAAGDDDPMLDVVARVLRACLARPAAQPLRVDRLAAEVGLSVRSLERVMREYVGVPPRWVLQRHRVHEVADRIAADPGVDLAAIAAELGWFDQAHLTRRFTAVVGLPPAAYARRCASAGGTVPVTVRRRASA